MTADLILTGGHVLTLSGPPARDIAIAGGRVLAVGRRAAKPRPPLRGPAACITAQVPAGAALQQAAAACRAAAPPRT